MKTVIKNMWFVAYTHDQLDCLKQNGWVGNQKIGGLNRILAKHTESPNYGLAYRTRQTMSQDTIIVAAMLSAKMSIVVNPAMTYKHRVPVEMDID